MGSEIEAAWQSASQVLFGKSLGKLGHYEAWLTANVPPTIIEKSAASGKDVYIPNFVFYDLTRKQSMKMEESLEWGKKHLEIGKVREISLGNAQRMLGEIRYFSPELEYGTNVGMEECGIYYNSAYCFRSNSIVATKYCAFSMWPRNCEHIFGCAWIFSCSFCIKCCHSESLTRCFEVSNSTSCADAYFCHNCENVRDSMFCFNAKNLRHAIGNVEYPKEEYAKAKQALLSQISQRLEKDKKLEMSIYNIGAKR